MLGSRFWYVLVALLLGITTFMLYLATSMYDRASRRAVSEGLGSDAQVVSWYMRDDARKRSSALINFALDDELSKALSKASASAERPAQDTRERAKKELASVEAKLSADVAFTALFAVDQYGRVIAQRGFDQASSLEDFELGGYPIVADALHGWIRDDAWVLDGRLYRVVARPVEGDASQPPVGAIVGAAIIDDSFARELSKRTGAAVAFYAAGGRTAAAAPEGFDTTQLDIVTADLGSLANDEAYQKKGRSELRLLSRDTVGAKYARVPGEGWGLGAGYAVARAASVIGSPFDILKKADDADKAAVSYPVVFGLALLAALVGIALTVLEYNLPLWVFRAQAHRMARGEIDQLAPSKFHFAFRKVAIDLNDGIEKVAAKGGVVRKAADLEQVLGPMPAQPAMSAFSFPGGGGSSLSPANGIARPSLPVNPAGDPPATVPRIAAASAIPPAASRDDEETIQGPSVPPPPRPSGPRRPPGPPPPRPSGSRPPTHRPLASLPVLSSPSEEGDSTTVSRVPDELLQAAATGHLPLSDEDGDDWPRVYEEFVRVKRQSGESVEGLTYDKFKGTLRKHRAAIIKEHGVRRVKFTVYLKDDGRAALKASPVKE